MSFQTFAVEYGGVILLKNNSQIKLRETALNKNFFLTLKNQDVKKVVQKLKPNDYVSFDGDLNEKSQSLEATSINFVGLSDLIAQWQGDDNYCYWFNTFTEFSIYPKPKNASCKSNSTSPRQFAYTINSAGENWFVLISDNQASYAADLKIINRTKIELKLYDPNSGRVLRLVKLAK